MRCTALLELAAAAPAATALAANVLHAGAALQSAVFPAAAAASCTALPADTLHTGAALPRLWFDLAGGSKRGGRGGPSVAVCPAGRSRRKAAQSSHGGAGATGALPRLWIDLAEAAAASAAGATDGAAAPRDDGWLTPIAQGLDWLLLYFQAQLNAAHVPYASGWAIVCLTLVTKTLTFPFTKIQARCSLACCSSRTGAAAAYGSCLRVRVASHKCCPGFTTTTARCNGYLTAALSGAHCFLGSKFCIPGCCCVGRCERVRGWVSSRNTGADT